MSGAFVALKPVLMSKVSELMQSEAILKALKVLPGLWQQSPSCFFQQSLALSSIIFLQREAGVVNGRDDFGLGSKYFGIRQINGFNGYSVSYGVSK